MQLDVLHAVVVGYCRVVVCTAWWRWVSSWVVACGGGGGGGGGGYCLFILKVRYDVFLGFDLEEWD